MPRKKIEKALEEGKEKLQEGVDKAEKMVKKVLPKK